MAQSHALLAGQVPRIVFINKLDRYGSDPFLAETSSLAGDSADV